MKKILAMILATAVTAGVMASAANAFPIKPIAIDDMQLSVIKLIDIKK